jgi:hypothetical protein
MADTTSASDPTASGRQPARQQRCTSQRLAYLWRGRFRTIETPAGIQIRRYGNRQVLWNLVQPSR